jgi:amino acid transporter
LPARIAGSPNEDTLLPISRSDLHDELRGRLTWRDRQPTFFAALLTALAVVILIIAFDSVSSFERVVALRSLTSSILWIAAALIGACGTIAALMLTTVSLMEHLDTRRMGPRFLYHLRLTVLGALATIALAVGALLLTTFPAAGGADVKPPTWQVNTVFFGLQGLTTLMVGGFAVVLSSLYATIAEVFRNLPRPWVEEILADEDADEEECAEEAERAEDAADRAEQAALTATGARDGHERPAGQSR